MRILIVEDDAELSDILVDLLREQHYAVDLAGDGDTADEMMAVNDYDLVVLDWSIPAPTGIDLLSSWRDAGQQTPVLMLTGRREVEDRVGGLDAGADDYLTKPFALDELLARVRSLLRRRERVIASTEVGDLVIDSASRRVTVGGEPVDLSPKEFAVLELLVRRVGEVVTRTDISEHAWDESFDAMSNVIDVVVYRLRKKVDGDREGRLIHTVKGEGYVLEHARR